MKFKANKVVLFGSRARGDHSEEAYARKIITDEESWLLMMKDRNLTSHVYQEELFIEIANRIMSRYVVAFEELLLKIV